jgi:hypothetical protein
MSVDLKSLPQSKNITHHNPKTWIGAYLVPTGSHRKGECHSPTYVYEEDLPKDFPIRIQLLNEPIPFDWCPGRMTITISHKNIIQSVTYE